MGVTVSEVSIKPVAAMVYLWFELIKLIISTVQIILLISKMSYLSPCVLFQRHREVFYDPATFGLAGLF